MKLASLRHGRDGRLVVVSDDLAWYAATGPEVPTLQAALDDWTHAEPRLKSLSEGVNNGTILRERFHEREAASPFPRAYQWADGSAYVNHVALVRQARGAKMPETFWTDPLIYQGGSDIFLGPRDAIPASPEPPARVAPGEVDTLRAAIFSIPTSSTWLPSNWVTRRSDSLETQTGICSIRSSRPIIIPHA
jgi:2-keto-4-pentenoate hydratase/2-oxohepta-3-ene-1,7-dioic acid hydratase in catechol pathway